MRLKAEHAGGTAAGGVRAAKPTLAAHYQYCVLNKRCAPDMFML
jgi:hypothetical protein